MAYDALLWVFVIFSGIAVGAGLYEMRINVPHWFARATTSETFVNVDAIRSDDAGRRFWAYVTTVPLTLLTLSSCVVASSPETARERWWLAGAGVMLVERISTFGYFIPQLMKLLNPQFVTRDKAAAARTWTRLNYLRAALAFAGWLAALRALSISS